MNRAQRLQAFYIGLCVCMAGSGNAAELMAEIVQGGGMLALVPMHLKLQPPSMPLGAYLPPRAVLATDVVPGSCEHSQALLCYNYQSGNTVYKPSRKLMPEIYGLQRESVSLKRDKITFRYSFR